MILRSSILTRILLILNAIIKPVVISSYSSILPRFSSLSSSKCFHPIRRTIRNHKHYLYSDATSDNYISSDTTSNNDNVNNVNNDDTKQHGMGTTTLNNKEEEYQKILLHLCSALFNLTSIPNIKDASYWNQVIRHIPQHNKKSVLKQYTTSEYALSILYYFKKRHIPASIFTYNSILNVMAYYGDGREASLLLKSMDDGLEDVYPDIISYNTVINAWKRSNVPDAVLQCEEILTQLLFSNTTTTNKENTQKPKTRSGKSKKKKQVLPDVISFNSVIDAWSKTTSTSDSSQSCTRVKFWLQTMNDLYKKTQNVRYKPDTTTYASIIDTFAKNNNAIDAEKTLKDIFENYKLTDGSIDADAEKKDGVVKPNLRCFNAVLNAWASISFNNVDAANRAQTILDLMEETSKVQGYHEIKPDKYAYNTVLKAYANSGLTTKAYALLQKMIDNSNKRANDLFDDVSFNTVIDSFSKKQRQKNQNQEQRSNNIKIAMRLYDLMEDYNVIPNVYTITSLLNVYAHCGEKNAGKAALDFLYKIEKEKSHIVLSTPAYNAVLNAWAKSRDYTSPKNIEQLIEHMEYLYESKENVNVKPNTISYSILANAWARSSNNAFRAQEILDKVERMYNDHGRDKQLRPNAHLYTTVINAWARSDEPYKAQKAYEILKRFEEFSATYGSNSSYNNNEKPNVFTYNAVLNACAYTSGDEDAKTTAFQIACTTFNEIRNSKKQKSKSNNKIVPNHVTYGAFLSACAKLLSQQEKTDKYPLIEAVFRKCCKDGQVGDLALYSLKDATTPKLFKKLLLDSKDIIDDGSSSIIDYSTPSLSSSTSSLLALLNDNFRSIQVENLPNKWTCKVKERRP